MSVQNSDEQANNAILELFDYNDERKSSSNWAAHWERDKEIYPLDDSSDAVFKKQEILHHHSPDEAYRNDTHRHEDIEEGRRIPDCTRSLKADKDARGPHLSSDGGSELYKLLGHELFVERNLNKPTEPSELQDDEDKETTIESIMEDLVLRIRNVPRRRTNHQHKTRRPKVSNQATLAHRRKMRPPNELERNTNAFHDRRPVYDLAFTTMVAFAKIAEDLGFNELADSATALPNALIEATGIRENRRKGEQRMTRKEQLRKVRHLLVDLNSEIDESYRRDLKALLSKLLTLFKKAWDQQNDQIRRIKTENIQSNEEGRRNSLKEKPELTPMKDKIYVNEIKESLNAGEQIIKQVVAESGESAQKALTGHIEAVQRTIARR